MKSQAAEKVTHATSTPKHLAALVSHQEAHCLAERRLSELDDAIAACESDLADASTNIPNVDNLLERRADLLADLAIGAASQADIDAIDIQISTETNAMAGTVKSAGQRKSNATQALVALRRRQEQVTQELQELNAASPDVVLDAISNEMELVCKEYVAAAVTLKAQFLRLTALERISKRFQRPGASRPGVNAVPGDVVFTVPLIRFPSCGALANKNNLRRGVLFSNEPYYGDFILQEADQVVADEIERLSAAGVARYIA